MFPDMPIWARLLLAAAVSFLTTYLCTPPVKTFAETVGAIDVPEDGRRVHTRPVPRMGGIAIFAGILFSLLVFVEIDTKVLGLILGASIIAVMGALDDIISINAWIKLLAQIAAAFVAIRCGIVFDAISNPNFLSANTTIYIGWLSVPLTVLWIVGCTNAVNLIDGLDGLAVGVSGISSATMLVVALLVAEPAVSVILAAVLGACIGFLPYNINPAKIFMGDVGSQTLGFILASVSIMGLFKLQAIITFLVPVLAMAVPLADTVFAFTRRILNHQNPFHADKKHFHHRLLNAGMSQKQAVAVLYGISAVLGLFAVLLTGQNPLLKLICITIGFLISLGVFLAVFGKRPKKCESNSKSSGEDKPEE